MPFSVSIAFISSLILALSSSVCAAASSAFLASSCAANSAFPAIIPSIYPCADFISFFKGLISDLYKGELISPLSISSLSVKS